LIGRLAGGDDIDAALDGLSYLIEPPPLAGHRAEIDRVFSLQSVEAVVAALDAEGTAWAQALASTIRAKSPTSLKVAFRLMREGRLLDFDACMRMEFRMVNRIIAGHDFYEGVRATIIDKDGAPRWRPDSLADVSAADVTSCFAQLGDRELQL
jgi:enoyl-CoA hydratase